MKLAQKVVALLRWQRRKKARVGKVSIGESVDARHGSGITVRPRLSTPSGDRIATLRVRHAGVPSLRYVQRRWRWVSRF